MGKKLISVVLCAALILSLPLCAFAEDPTQERIPAAFYRTANTSCFFFFRTVIDFTPVSVKTERLSDYGVLPSLISEGRTPITYVVLMDATWYMSERKAAMKELIRELFDNGFMKTRVILAPYDINNGVLWDYMIDSESCSSTEQAVSALQQQIDSITYSYQGENVPPNGATLELLQWLQGAYPAETGGVVNVILTSYLLRSLNVQPEQVEEIQQKLWDMPQILFHTVQLGQRDGDIPNFNRGIQLVVTDDYSTAMAANDLNAYVGNMERILIPRVSQEVSREDVLLFFKPLAKAPDGTDIMPNGITMKGVPYVVTANVDAQVEFDVFEGVNRE